MKLAGLLCLKTLKLLYDWFKSNNALLVKSLCYTYFITTLFYLNCCNTITDCSCYHINFTSLCSHNTPVLGKEYVLKYLHSTHVHSCRSIITYMSIILIILSHSCECLPFIALVYTTGKSSLLNV